jgi:hypothetical protein
LDQWLSFFKSTNPQWTPFNITLQEFTTVTKPASLLYSTTAKILGLKGKHKISSLQSAERGSLVTAVTFISPTGHFIPPLLLFPRQNMKQELMNGIPPELIHLYHHLGWIESEIFSSGFFILSNTQSQQKKILLS